MINKKEIENEVNECIREGYSLEINPLYKDIDTSDFVPNDLEFPDAERYFIVNNETGDFVIYADNSEYAQQIIKKMKTLNGIVDPWDNDPEYFKKKIAENRVKFSEDVENGLKDIKGNYYLLGINPVCENIHNEEYFPELPSYPDACRYMVYFDDINQGESNVIFYENVEIKDAIVKKLKKFHGITDPWDDNPELINRWDEISTDDIIKQAEKKGQKLKGSEGTNNISHCIEFGEKQIGKRKTQTFLYANELKKIRERWRLYSEDRDIKVISWTELVESNKEEIYQDMEILLEKHISEDDTMWRLVSQTLFRKYLTDKNKNKHWIGAEYNGIERIEKYDFEDSIKVKFAKDINK